MSRLVGRSLFGTAACVRRQGQRPAAAAAAGPRPVGRPGRSGGRVPHRRSRLRPERHHRSLRRLLRHRHHRQPRHAPLHRRARPDRGTRDPSPLSCGPPVDPFWTPCRTLPMGPRVQKLGRDPPVVPLWTPLDLMWTPCGPPLRAPRV